MSHPPHDHQHDHHRHAHQHGHDHDFDWVAMAHQLELDAFITEPIVYDVLAGVEGPVEHVLDVGSGPGAVALALAAALPDAEVIALDTSAALLERAHAAAEQRGSAERLQTVVGDLDEPLPPTGPMDLVWASMVLHHVADPVATLRRLHERLRRDGTLVMVEFGEPPTVLPETDPLMRSGTWQRFRDATERALSERLGFDPVALEWPDLLVAAGFDHVDDTSRYAHHPAPLSPMALEWLVAHVTRGVEMAGDRLSATDAAALLEFVGIAHTRDDLTVVAARRVLTARPG